MIEIKKCNDQTRNNIHDDINYLLYVERDYENSLSQINKKFAHLKLNDKHKCNRDSHCECVKVGLLLVDIFQNYPTGKSLTTFMENFYYFSHLIPFKVIKYMIRSRLNVLDFSEVKKIIDSYITYSIIPTEVQSETNIQSNTGSYSNKFNSQISKEDVSI